MEVVVSKQKIDGRTVAPPSKSQAHRYAVATLLSMPNGEGLSFVDTLASFNDDVFSTVEGLKKIIDRKMDCTTVNVAQSASTLRFLLPIACALKRSVKFVGEGRVMQRPIYPLVNALNENGADINVCDDCICVEKGNLKNGEFNLTGSVSSQFVSGLMFALPLLEKDSEIIIDGALSSKGYVDMTVDALADFDVKVLPCKNGYFIEGGQCYCQPKHVSIEGDWSSAAVLLSMGALCGSVCVDGINAQSRQPDVAILDVLHKIGANVVVGENCVCVSKNRLVPTDVCVDGCPDIAPIVAVLLANANGVSKISGASRLRYKESDRFLGIVQMLGLFGIKCDVEGDALLIYGGKVCAGEFSTDDHRMAMSATVLGLCADGESKIQGAECISKSYPHFLKDIGRYVEVK